MGTDLIDQDGFRKLADVAFHAARADHVFVRLTDRRGGTTRFANSQIVQNVNTRRHQLSVSVAFGKQTGISSVTDLSPQSIRGAVGRAEQIARVTPSDPEYLPPLGPQRYAAFGTASADTAGATGQRLLADAGAVIGLCEAEKLVAAGIVSAYVSAEGLAAETGLYAYEQRSNAEFSLTATGMDSTGWVRNTNRSIDALKVTDAARIAIDKAKRSANPREISAGRYTVILEPAAVAGLVDPLRWIMDAKSYHRGTSALSGKLNQPIIDTRLTLANDPADGRLFGKGFNHEGLPGDNRTWIDGGVLKQLAYDRFTAGEHGVDPTPSLDAPVLSATGPAASSVDQLVAETSRGILVTNFWYIRFVNPTDLTLTGMTRDGTFLVEDGQIVTGLVNFRWHDSPLRVLNQVQGFTAPTDAMGWGKMLLPAMRIDDFNFSSVTKF